MIIALLRNILRRPPRPVLDDLPSQPVFQDHDGPMRRLPPIADASQLELMLLLMKR